MSQSSRNSPSHMDEAGVTRWDRSRWISVFSSHNPTIREVTECLGLGLSASSSTTNRGIPKFDNPEYRKLSTEVTRLSKELPKEREPLLDFAADPNSLHHELEGLLATFGTTIWGRNTDRSCLLTPDPSKKTYPRDLFFEDPEDKEILKIHLHRWIIIKACYYIRNMKLKRPSSANDYDTIADMDDGEPISPNKAQMSPNDTPQSLTPSTDGLTTAGAEFTVKPVTGQKRKSSIRASYSDGDEHDLTPAAKRYQSHTMPISKSSPRKSVMSFVADGPQGMSENIPPVPSLPHSHSNGIGATNGASTSDSTRPQLTTLSSNDLNGAARTPNPTPPANGFTAVNTSFTSINASPPAVKLSPSQRPVAPAPAMNGRNYSSPYDSSPFHGAPMAPKASSPPKAPPLVTSTSALGFQAINSPVTANGNAASVRNSPIAQHVAPPPLSSQQHTIQAQPQPTSRSSTPIMHHHHRGALTQQRSSRSSTPIAPSVTSQPMQQAQLAPSAPPHQSPLPSGAPQPQSGPPPAPQPLAPQHMQPGAARVHQVVNVPPVPAMPGVYNPAQPPPVLRSHPYEAAPPPHQLAESDLGLLQCEVLGSLLQYLFPRATSPPDENVVLHKMESLWNFGKMHYRKEVGQHYELQSRILSTWITERRKIAELRHTFTYSPAVPATEMIERLLALNDLRMMRLKWKNMSSAVGLSTEDLLCQTFMIMTNTEGTMHLFKEGLDRLNEGIFEFLRTEDMRILMHSKR